jgi:hypothetical protein
MEFEEFGSFSGARAESLRLSCPFECRTVVHILHSNSFARPCIVIRRLGRF